MMKKFYNNTDDVEKLAMANCAMIMNRAKSSSSSQPGRIFECKSCKRGFETFQALGGHTASHKRPKFDSTAETQKEQIIMKRTYKCSICEAVFWTGQALGGHMSRHRKNSSSSNSSSFVIGIENKNTTSSTITSSDDDHSVQQQQGGGGLKMLLNDKTINLGLDLNLSPEENEIKCFNFFN